MIRLRMLLVAAPVAVGLLSAPAAHAEWRGGWGHGWGGHPGWGHPGYGWHAGWRSEEDEIDCPSPIFRQRCRSPIIITATRQSWAAAPRGGACGC